MLRIFPRFSLNVRETFKTNEIVWKETTESHPTPQFTTCRALLVPATDDRVVAGSNPSVAASKLGALGKFVDPTLHTAVLQVYFDIISCRSLLYGVYDGGSKNMFELCTINIDFLKEIFFKVLLSRILSGLAIYTYLQNDLNFPGHIACA